MKRNGGDDAIYGEGKFGTPLGPENERKVVAQNNYGKLWEHFENMGHLDVAIRLVIDDQNVDLKSVRDREINLHKGDFYLDKCDEVDVIYLLENRQVKLEK